MSSQSEDHLVWVGPNDRMPEVCCSCGMFSDRRVKVKQQLYIAKSKRRSGLGTVAMVILHLVAGPVAWLIDIVSSRSDASDVVTKKKTVVVRIPQCPLCQPNQPPQVIETSSDPIGFGIMAHPKFAIRMKELRASEADEGQSIR